MIPFTKIFNWTDAAVADLRRLHAEEYSFSGIAAELARLHPKNGDLTRNACIGKANRIGLADKRRVRPPVTSPRKPRVRNDRRVAPQESPAQVKMRMADFAAAMTAAIAPDTLAHEAPASPPPLVPDLPAAPPEPPRADGLIHLTALRGGVCHFPVGDPLKSDFGFCGAATPTGKTYCAHHHKICYLPPTPRRVRSDQSEPFRLPKMWMDA